MSALVPIVMGMYLLLVTPFSVFPTWERKKRILSNGVTPYNVSALDRNANHGFGDSTIEHFMAQNIFPLEAPNTLNDKDVEKFDRLLARKLISSLALLPDTMLLHSPLLDYPLSQLENRS